MHRTDSGEKRKDLKDEARELARDARALQKVAVHPRLAGRRKAARRGGEGPGRGPGPQAPGPAGGPDRVADGEGQAEPQGLQDLQLLDDLLTADQRTRNVHLGECQEDGWQGGQGDEGGGAV